MFSSRRLNEKVMVSHGWLEDILIGSSLSCEIMGLSPILVYPNCCHKTLLTAYEQQALSSHRGRQGQLWCPVWAQFLVPSGSLCSGKGGERSKVLKPMHSAPSFDLITLQGPHLVQSLP